MNQLALNPTVILSHGEGSVPRLKDKRHCEILRFLDFCGFIKTNSVLFEIRFGSFDTNDTKNKKTRRLAEH